MSLIILYISALSTKYFNKNDAGYHYDYATGRFACDITGHVVSCCAVRVYVAAGSPPPAKSLYTNHLARLMGLEPTTTGSTGRYSNQLSYNPVKKRGARKPYPPIVSYSPLSRGGVTPGGFTPFDLRTDLGPLCKKSTLPAVLPLGDN